MGKIIYLENIGITSTCHEGVMGLIAYNQDSINTNISVYPHESSVLLRVLLQERKEVLHTLNLSISKSNKTDINYWKNMHDVFNNLIKKIKTDNTLTDTIPNLSFLELDCLVGAIEEFLQERALLELQIIEDDIPYITNALYQLYNKVLPIYEIQRNEMDSMNVQRNN